MSLDTTLLKTDVIKSIAKKVGLNSITFVVILKKIISVTKRTNGEISLITLGAEIGRLSPKLRDFSRSVKCYLEGGPLENPCDLSSEEIEFVMLLLNLLVE